MDTLYHVTFKNRINDIKKQGIVCIREKEIFSSFIKKHHDSIYAFFTLEDALKWWEYMGNEQGHLIPENGDPVIVEFTDDTSKYEFDSHWQMRQDFPSAVYKKDCEDVKPEQIKGIIDYSTIKYSSLKSSKEKIFDEWYKIINV